MHLKGDPEFIVIPELEIFKSLRMGEHKRYTIYESELPPMSHESVQYIDATPNDAYVFRILGAHLNNNKIKFVDSSGNPELEHPLLVSMNDT